MKTHTYCTPVKIIVVQSHTDTPETRQLHPHDIVFILLRHFVHFVIGIFTKRFRVFASVVNACTHT